MLKDKVAVITGASRGIGKAIAETFAENGANLVINYVSNKEAVEEFVSELQGKGIKAIAVQGDVSDFEQAKGIIDAAINEFGKIDILVNNAGITRDNLILRMKEEEFDKVIDINLKGAFNCIKHASKPMLKNKAGGRIINMASVIGITGNAGQLNYAAAKAGIIGMTKSAAKEFAPRNITVNAIAPGFIETDMTAVLKEEVKAEILKAVPLKAFGKVEDVANVALFLASDNSRYITGQVINVDGGMVM